MAEEPSDEELRELGAPPRMSRKMVIGAVVAGMLAAVLLVVAAQIASERAQREEPAVPSPSGRAGP